MRPDPLHHPAPQAIEQPADMGLTVIQAPATKDRVDLGDQFRRRHRPREDGALSRMMGWIGVTHVRRHHEHFHTRGGGHLYQGRFKSFPVQDDLHLLTVARYIEANAVRAGLVSDAIDWPWGGFFARRQGGKPLTLAPWPVDRPGHWRELLRQDPAAELLAEVRQSVNRGRPYGEIGWVERVAKRLGLASKLRNPGRPKKPEERK